MIVHSRYLRKFLGNRKGYSGLLATIFMVLVVFSICFGVFTFVLDRNTAFQDVASRVQQMDVDRSTEQIAVSNVSCKVDVDHNNVTVSCIITNTCPLSVEIVRLWVQDDSPTAGTSNYANINTSIVLQPGNSTVFNRSVNMNGLSSSDEFTLWFVTARGNQVSFSLPQVAGNFVPDYRSVQWAQCTNVTNDMRGLYDVTGSWSSSRTLPDPNSSISLVWRIKLIYYGSESITIDKNSMLSFVPLAQNGVPENYTFTCYIVSSSFDENTTHLNPYGDSANSEVTVGYSYRGMLVTLYFSSPDHSPGMTGGISNQDIASIGGGMMSLTIYGESPSNYGQTFPLFAYETQGS